MNGLTNECIYINEQSDKHIRDVNVSKPTVVVVAATATATAPTLYQRGKRKTFYKIFMMSVDKKKIMWLRDMRW